MSEMNKTTDAVRRLYLAKGDAVEAAIVEGLVRRGVSEENAMAAARECSSRIWRNGMMSGAATGVIVGAIGTPVAGAFAGGAMATIAGYHTFLHSDACRDARSMSDLDVQTAVDRILKGF